MDVVPVVSETITHHMDALCTPGTRTLSRLVARPFSSTAGLLLELVIQYRSAVRSGMGAATFLLADSQICKMK
ncbi:MAG: hypothetical protein NC311_05680 [Muribaculaceae bacterium]|nr:hypothetical protein [Muribaculaceae bacterium]